MRFIANLTIILALTMTGSVYAGDLFSASSQSYPVDSNPRAICTADFNSDGVADLAVANTNSHNVSVLLGVSDGTFSATVNYPAGSRPSGVAAADINGDTYIDLAVSNFTSNNVSILLNNGDGTFAGAVNYPVGVSGNAPYAIVAAQLNGAGLIDLATANYWGDSVSVLINNDDGTFLAPVTYYVGASATPVSIASADIDKDHALDLIVACSGLDSVAVMFNNGDGTFAIPVYYAAADGPSGVGAADLNNDGWDDLALSNSASHDLSVLLNAGDGTFGVPNIYHWGSGARAVTLVKLDGDDYIDIAQINFVSNDVSIYINQGDGTFVGEDYEEVGNGPAAICSADFDGDGDMDLAVANFYDNTVTVILNSTGEPTDVTPPRAIVDLDFTLIGTDTLVLYWTAPGDDSSDGQAAYYDLRYNYIGIINEDDYNSAYQYLGTGAPSPSGSLDSLRIPINDLQDVAGQSYVYLNLRAADELDQYGPLGNTVEVSLVIYLCGDIDGSGTVDLMDVDYFIDYLFRFGPAPVDYNSADVDSSGLVDILDVEYYIDWLLRFGPNLNCP